MTTEQENDELGEDDEFVGESNDELEYEEVEYDVDPLPLRFFGDQVLRARCEPITDVTGDLVEFAERLLVTMEIEVGIGLAAPQVGEKIQLFVHAIEDAPTQVLINPQIAEVGGEWVYREGCLSIPGLYYEIVRPKQVLIRCVDLEGEEIEFEADEILSRVCQHEYDHLFGVLMVDRLTEERRFEADTDLRGRVDGTLGASDPFLTGGRVRGLRKAKPKKRIKK